MRSWTRHLTKFIGGHGTSIGGVIIDSGQFDWVAKPAQQPLMNTPDDSYHGAIWGQLVPEALGAPIAFAIRARVVALRDLGPAISPTNAFQIIQNFCTFDSKGKLLSKSPLNIPFSVNWPTF